VIKREGKMYKRYNASTSYSEKQKHVGNGLKVNHNYLNHIEGIESLVLCKGPVSDIVTKFEANLKASFSYSGAKNISGFWKRAKFVRVTNQGIKENGSHNVLTEKTKGN
jgi:IMP dehydrogenase/GMP reductase